MGQVRAGCSPEMAHDGASTGCRQLEGMCELAALDRPNMSLLCSGGVACCYGDGRHPCSSQRAHRTMAQEEIELVPTCPVEALHAVVNAARAQVGSQNTPLKEVVKPKAT